MLAFMDGVSLNVKLRDIDLWRYSYIDARSLQSRSLDKSKE